MAVERMDGLIDNFLIRKVVSRYFHPDDIAAVLASPWVERGQEKAMARWMQNQKNMSLSANLVAARTLSLDVQSRLLSPALHQRAGRVCMRMQLAGYNADQIDTVSYTVIN
jgi:hypothetical protein